MKDFINISWKLHPGNTIGCRMVERRQCPYSVVTRLAPSQSKELGDRGALG